MLCTMPFRMMAAGALSLLLASCGALPSAGPSSIEIEADASHEADDGGDYIVVDLDRDIVATLTSFQPQGFTPFRAAGASSPRSRIGVGDVLAITVWESGEGGLFSSSTTKSVSMPEVVVDRSGQISLPYAGLIPVVGKSPIDVQEDILAELQGRAIQPQVTVSIVKNESNTVVLNGDIVKPGRYPLSLKGDRLLDVIADAGGTKFPAQETYVTFIRGEQRGSQLLKEVVDNEADNVFVRAGDQIYLTHEPKTFTVLGAIAKPGLYPFGTAYVSLLEAVAGAGGLLDDRADSTGLFVFRHEPRHVAEAIAGWRALPAGPVVPVVYRVNMRDASAYFYAKAFSIQDKDVIYVANAKGAEIGKVLRMVNAGRSLASW